MASLGPCQQTEGPYKCLLSEYIEGHAMSENLGVFLDNQKFQYSESPIVGKSVGSDINSLGSDPATIIYPPAV